MKKVLFLFFVLYTTLSAVAQELNTFKYIVVPTEFEFLKEPNQYDLNALTKFLLEKKGYEVYLEGEEGMENLSGDRCEALMANLRNESGWFVTKLQLVLKDCRNREVVVSEIGDSRIKDFQQAYHEALREAVESIPEKADAIEEAVVTAVPQVDVEKANEVERVEGEVKEETTSNSIEESPEAAQMPRTSAPEVSRLEFVRGNGKYYLTKTEKGYNFYQQGMGEPFAALIESSTGSSFVYSSITSKGMARFNEKGNLVVEILDPETNELETIEYELQDQ